MTICEDDLKGVRPTPLRLLFHSKPVLLVAFAFAVMADPVSSVAYAIEAALRALGGNLSLLLPTMALVMFVIAMVILNYHILVGRFPGGGVDAAAVGRAFGEEWAFIPIGALVLDFVLTISISVAAASSAVTAYFPFLGTGRVLLALGLLLFVAGLTWFGHGGRAVFAVMDLSFVAVGSLVIAAGLMKAPALGTHALAPTGSGLPAGLVVLFAFPVAMALATGVEAPSSAMAQLGQLDDRGRTRFARVTLWLTLLIVSGLTIGITGLAVRFGIGLPPPNSTEMAELARTVVNPPLFALFQLTTAVLLLAAASSSFQAGPGLLKAMARTREGVGILPRWMGRTNRHHTPYWGVVLCLAISATVVAAAGAREQELVLFYAVAVFVAFLSALVSLARFSKSEGKLLLFALNALGTLVVAFTLAVDLGRGFPIVSLAAALLIAAVLYLMWVRAGRPRGVAEVIRLAETGRD